MQIHIAKSGQQMGPFPIDQVKSMIDAGMVSSSDLAWRDGLPDWQPLHQVMGLPPPVPVRQKPSEITSEAEFLYIPTSRLILLSLISCGIFNSYWVYKNWDYIKKRDNLNIMPFWRGFWCIFHFHSLLKYIKEDPKTSHIKQATYSAGWLTTGFVIFVLIGNQAFIPALIAFLFFIPVHNHIQFINESREIKPAYTKWTFGQIFCAAIIPAFFIICFIIGFIGAVLK